MLKTLGVSTTLATALALSVVPVARSQIQTLDYSNYLAIPANYNGPVCVQLGQWDGSAKVLLQTEKFYADIAIRNSTHHMVQALHINANSNLGSMITISTDRPINPSLTKGFCKISTSASKVHSLNWRRR